MTRVLVVEDEKPMAELLRKALAEQEYSVRVAHTGADGLHMASEFPFDILLLDVMLPGMDGFAVGRELRRLRIPTPILFLTARDTLGDIVAGLDNGGDDYLTKPFSFAELLARLRALARRRPELEPDTLRAGDLVLNPLTREVVRAGTAIELTRIEYLLLEFLMKNTRRVVRRQTLIEAGWGFSFNVGNNNLDVFMRNLRLKIDHGRPIPLLQTIRGVGYRLRPPEGE